MYSENAMIVADYIKAHQGENFTAQDIADATGLGVKTVNGVVTAGLQKKGLAERVPTKVAVTVEDKEGNPVEKEVEVKFIVGTPALYDLDMVAANEAEVAAKEAEKAAKAAAKAAAKTEE